MYVLKEDHVQCCQWPACQHVPRPMQLLLKQAWASLVWVILPLFTWRIYDKNNKENKK